MGTYHTYELDVEMSDKDFKWDHLPISLFDDIENVSSLLDFSVYELFEESPYVESKRWDAFKDLETLTKHNAGKQIVIFYTHEDTSSRYKVLFKNGKHTSVESVYPAFNMSEVEDVSHDLRYSYYMEN